MLLATQETRPMRRGGHSELRWLAGAVAALLLSAAPAAAQNILAVHGEKVYPVSAPVLEDGVVLVQDGKIVAIGPASEVEVPAGAQVLRAAVVTPGLVDAHSVVGLAGILNSPHDQDQLELSEALQPELRAIDAYDARESLIAWLRSFGVTTVHTGHGPGATLAGQTLIAKTVGDSVEEAVLVPEAMVAGTLGDGAKGKDDKSPGTRSKVVALLRQAFLDAQSYRLKLARAEDEKKPDRNLRSEALLRILDGEIPLLLTAQRHQDIDAALRLQKEFGFRLVLDGAAEAPLLLDRLKAANVPIFLHPTMARPRGEQENLSMATAALLAQAGIPFAFQSGFESYVPKTRVILFEAAAAVAQGLPRDKALEALTLQPAHFLGLQSRLGSLEVGKDADIALYDGDPFETTSHCVGVVIDGVLVSSEKR